MSFPSSTSLPSWPHSMSPTKPLDSFVAALYGLPHLRHLQYLYFPLPTATRWSKQMAASIRHEFSIKAGLGIRPMLARTRPGLAQTQTSKLTSTVSNGNYANQPKFYGPTWRQTQTHVGLARFSPFIVLMFGGNWTEWQAYGTLLNTPKQYYHSAPFSYNT